MYAWPRTGETEAGVGVPAVVLAGVLDILLAGVVGRRGAALQVAVGGGEAAEAAHAIEAVADLGPAGDVAADVGGHEGAVGRAAVGVEA